MTLKLCLAYKTEKHKYLQNIYLHKYVLLYTSRDSIIINIQ